LRGDDGFEDREGHQTPFTLPIFDCRFSIGNCERSTINREREAITKFLLKLLDGADDLVEIRPVAGVEFGMEKFAIGAKLESAAARGNER
jgi:hypothetical protein